MTERSSIFGAYLALAVVCFFWGTTYLAIKIGVNYIPGFIFAGIRNILAGSVTIAYFMMKGTKLPDKKTFKILFIRGILLVLIGNAVVHWAEQFISSGLAAIIAALVPFFIMAFSIFMFKSTRINSLILIGLVVGFTGIIAVFFDNLNEFSDINYIVGIAAMLLATIAWALGSVYSSFNKLEIKPVFGAGIQMFTAGLISLIIGFLIGERTNLMIIPLNGYLAVLYLSLIGSILTYNAYMYALSKLPPAQVSIYAYVNPIVAVVLGWLILDERLTLHIIISILVTLFGVYLVNLGFQKSKLQSSKDLHK